MKTIGLIGGMSWESSAEYYRIINESIKSRLGGYHSAKILLNSIDFAEIEAQQRTGKWQNMAQSLCHAALSLEKGGADFVLLCTNTMHKVAPQLEAALHIPFLHIADALGDVLRQQGIKKAGLLGTRFTMEEDFYRQRLQSGFGLAVCIPSELEDRQFLHDVIFNELCLGVINPQSRARYSRIMQGLMDDGAEAMILGCTEIGLLVKAADCPVPMFDTTRIHAEAAVNRALID